MREQIEKIYDAYCNVRKLSKEQGELQTWGKEPMIEFAEQAILQLKQTDVMPSGFTMKQENAIWSVIQFLAKEQYKNPKKVFKRNIIFNMIKEESDW